MQTKDNNKIITRSPVVAIMGHVDHGKSTLLDYIRKTNIVDSEAGGITQKISAYEVTHTTSEGTTSSITFLDTPGHESFQAIRARGAQVADIAILVVSAEDGVKPQTIEAYKTILSAKIPFIVAANKMDREGADIERTKAGLAENEIYVEGYGGTVPMVPISAKTGQGIPELLDMIVLQAELEELTGDTSVPANGVIIEANLDKKKGISATLIIKNGTVKSGEYLMAGTASAPVRIMENFLGKQIKEATFSSPIRIIGWSELPPVGSTFTTVANKKEAEKYIAEFKEKNTKKEEVYTDTQTDTVLPVVLKANDVGGLDAIKHEMAKIKHDKLKIKIVQGGVGEITETDIKTAAAREKTLVIGFNVKVDGAATSLAEKLGIEIKIFDIIYKLSEWFAEVAQARAPKTLVEEPTGTAKVLKLFSATKDKQILGGRVEKGMLILGAEVKIMRRDFEIGKGKVRELQKQKNKVSEVPEGNEFGAMIECKIDIAPGDKLESFRIVEK